VLLIDGAFSSVDASGLVAHVDLFAVSRPEELQRAQTTENIASTSLDAFGGLSSSHQVAETSEKTSGQHAEWPGGRTIKVNEDVMLTAAVFGSSFVHAVQVLDMSGEQVILFVFAVS
jgi:hypothetical protein